MEEGYDLKLKDGVTAWLNGALRDPIVEILAKNSQLTKIQLETLLIDVLSENISGKQLKYDEKAALRLTRAKISRGSFNRTLKQSRENVIKSIYTVLLLGYLGVFETTTLDPYLEIANKLHDYVEAHQDIPNKEEELKDHLKVIEIIRNELETSLKRLSSPSEEGL
jgi:predicted house-cleaning noncanonical NTP pyrophosphatase (MazG superfamily)